MGSNVISEFEKLFRQKLQLNNCKLRKKKQENNYEITTPASDVFLMYWSEFPEINLIYQPIGVKTPQTLIYEQAIRAHVKACVNSVRNSVNSNVVTLNEEN
jgi:hypothetical protein